MAASGRIIHTDRRFTAHARRSYAGVRGSNTGKIVRMRGADVPVMSPLSAQEDTAVVIVMMWYIEFSRKDKVALKISNINL